MHKYGVFKKGLAIGVLLLLLAAITPPLAAAEDSTINAEIPSQVTVAAATPSITFSLYSDSGYTTTTTDLVPQTPVYMKIDVSTDNILEEVTIKVDMFADNDANTVGTPPSSTSPSTYVTFTISWDSNQGAWVLNADTGGSSTWQIQFDPNKNQPSKTDTTGTFYVIIVPGKTAAEATPGESHTEYQDWDIIATATVAGQASNSYKKSGYTMYFYGEVTTTTSSLDFGTVQPKSTSSAKQVSVTAIANGDFNLVTYASSTWKNGNYIIQLTTGSPGNGEFRINASTSYDSTNNKLSNPVTLGSDLSTAATIVQTVEGPTSESGLSYTIYYQLELGTGIHTGTYSGNIYIYAVDAG